MCQILFLLSFPIPTVRCRWLFRPSCGRLSKRLSQFSELFWLLSIQPFSNHHLDISSTITQVIPVSYCQHCGMGISGPKLKAETHRGTEEKAGLCWCNCVIRRSTRASAARLVSSVATCVSCVSQKQERWWNHVLARHTGPATLARDPPSPNRLLSVAIAQCDPQHWPLIGSGITWLTLIGWLGHWVMSRARSVTSTLLSASLSPDPLEVSRLLESLLSLLSVRMGGQCPGIWRIGGQQESLVLFVTGAVTIECVNTWLAAEETCPSQFHAHASHFPIFSKQACTTPLSSTHLPNFLKQFSENLDYSSLQLVITNGFKSFYFDKIKLLLIDMVFSVHSILLKVDELTSNSRWAPHLKLEGSEARSHSFYFDGHILTFRDFFICNVLQRTPEILLKFFFW